MFIVLQNTSGNGLSWELGSSPLVIGRSEGCDIRIYDARLSRRHTRIWLEDGAVRFEDLGSRNATLVNGAPADAGALKPGDTLSAGTTLFRIVERVAPRPPRKNGPEATPITISARLATYLREPEGTDAVPYSYRTVRELHDLFHLGRELGAVETLADLAALLERTLREQFEAQSIWIAWRYAEGQALAWEPLDGADPPDPQALTPFQHALDRREGLVKPGVHVEGDTRLPQTDLAIPMVHADEVLGGFLLRGRAPGRTWAEDDLQYALGIAAIAAPHIRAVRHAEQLRRDNEALQARTGACGRLLGESPAIQRVREVIARAGNSNLPVLILGETGTGKEIAARMLHNASPRGEGPYVVVNCAAIPDHLFESEFFGHEKGAFTGATQQRRGRFEEAHGGTLFLDEVGDLSLDNQARILRAIETSTFHRVGGAKSITVDVRIVAATNKALDEPEFRKDLLHRLNAVTIAMPPLRDRPADIPDLARHFLRLSSNPGPVHVTGLRPDAIARLQQHPWPGNVRELKAAIDRAILFAHGPELGPGDFPLSGHDGDAPDPASVSSHYTRSVSDVSQADTSRILTLAEIEREHIQYVLKICQGNIAKAARTLGTNRVLLYKRIAEYSGE